ncbi:MAG: SIR2 family protein [Gammaproteobacteria bacterium]|nr:SIR2 family protein [Gammaproteobacteria bacterium]
MHDDAPEKIKPYLDEIAGRLWSNNAVVMVGAGFSRNAKPRHAMSRAFPNWRELGDIFYEKLHGRPPGIESRYLSIPKLAEQIHASFGRPALDDLLRQAIPNLDIEPSSLHSQLLSLPWKDVLTTNYDTLLERARASVTLNHYDVVETKADLLYAKQPRIVKLHGSFPSPPFVVSEEDYRRYPSDHAPFVNTVRQSLLENTLCLIGFSGDDPNFLQWIGWMRDNLGQEAVPKIYWVGVLDATEADRRLLDQRGIVTVDLKEFDEDHEDAFGKFLNYLKRHKSNAGDWPTVSPDARSWAFEADRERYSDIAAEWRRQRMLYPGWVIVPEDRRRILWRYTERWLWHFPEIPESGRAELGTPLDLDLAFELGWRLERCLFPLTEELSKFLKEVAGKYSEEIICLPETTDWTNASVFEAVTTIQLWLLRHYREEGMFENWQETRRAINKNSESLLPEHKVRFRLEEALQALFRFEPVEAKQLLFNWQSSETLPFWDAKRAALLAEMGETAAARSILESSLSAVRRQLSLSPILQDYTLASQESVVMLLLWAVERHSALKQRDSDESGFLDEMSERWNELARYKCDPRREIAWLSARLQPDSQCRGQESKSHGFDLGTVSTTIHFESDEEVVAAFGMMRMYEDIGMPYRIEQTTFVKEPIESTLRRVRNYSPHWALANIVRLGEANAADGLFDREYLAGLGREEVDGLVDIYLPAFERTIAMVNDSDWSEAKTYKLLAQTLPEVFSRLCYKCSPEYRGRLVSSLGSIYGSKQRGIFQGVSRFADRLFDSMSVEERTRAVPQLLDFQMSDNQDARGLQEFANPLLLVSLPRSARENNLSISVSAERIDDLLDVLADSTQNCDWTAISLMWLHNQDKLSQEQCERFGELLWKGFEDSGIPKVTGFYCFACIDLPHPATLNVESRIKDHLKAMIEERIDRSALSELCNSASMINWTWAEVLKFVATLSEWWEKNKVSLHHQAPMPFGSPAERTRSTTNKAVDALAEVISHQPVEQGQNNGNEMQSLREFLSSLESCGIPAKRLGAAALGMEDDTRERMIEHVVDAMLDNDEAIVIDALNAGSVLARVFAAEDTRHMFVPVGAMLAQGVKWRHLPGLAFRLRVAANLVNNHPWFLSAEVLSDMLAGLGEIADGASGEVRGNDEDGVIAIRAAAGSLAFALYGYCHELEMDAPRAIQDWREICSDPNEFAEVRNSWRDA